MGLDLAQLLSMTVYRALDVDAGGRVLVATDEPGAMQLAEIGPDGRPTMLTALPGACFGRYIPGRRTAVVWHDEAGNERMQLSLLDLDGRDRPATLDDLTPLVHDPRYVHYLAEVTATHVVYTTNRRNGVDFDVIVRDLATGAERVGYDGGGNIGSATLSPDGRRLALTRPARPALSDQILVVDLDTGERREITGADEHARHTDLSFTPGSDALVATTNRGRDLCGLARFDLADGGGWSWLATDDEWDVTGWPAPDGTRILVHTNVDGAARLNLADGDGRRLRDVELPDVGCVDGNPLPAPSWSADSSRVSLSFAGPRVPGDALLLDVATGEVRTLTDSAAPLAGVEIDLPTVRRVPTPDGEQVPCFVFRPAGGDGAVAVGGSAVVIVHGGPEAQFTRGYHPVALALVLAGHTVVAPNVRGSTGYGKRWYSLDDVRLRLDSVADLAAVHDHLADLGLDPTRAALYGGSYGGYMVLAGLAFQPGRWAAGVDIVGMSSLETFLRNTSAYRRAIREREYGSLEHDLDFLRAASPLTRIDAIDAPLLVIHGANDPRVPLTEAEQVHAAVTANGVPCELLVFGDEGHGLAKRANRLVAYPRVVEFLGRHLSG